jgi:WD40 repeat protein
MHDDNVKNAQFNQQGNLIVTASVDNTAKVWDLDSLDPDNPQPRYTFRHDRSVNNAQFNQDGNLIVTASADNTARVWDIGTGQMVKSARKI